jgi:hypothetical protein
MDVIFSSDDDTVATLKPDVMVDQKVPAGDDAGDDGHLQLSQPLLTRLVLVCQSNQILLPLIRFLLSFHPLAGVATSVHPPLLNGPSQLL